MTIIREGEVPQPMMHPPRALLLEPGSSVSHRGMAVCAELGVAVFWVARGGTRCLAYDASALLRVDRLAQQIDMHWDPARARSAAQHMLLARFGIRSHPRHSVDVVRGREGREVRKAYARMAEQYGVSWDRRRYDQPWPEASLINRSISVATSCLYGLTEVAIALAGYSPHLGVLHRAKRRAFVFDIADLVKFETVVPLAFRAVATGSEDAQWITRAWCADLFREGWLLDQLTQHAEETVNASASPKTPSRRRR